MNKMISSFLPLLALGLFWGAEAAVPLQKLPVDFRADRIEEGRAAIYWDSLQEGSFLYRATAPGGPWTLLSPTALSAADQPFVDLDVAPGVLYYYKVAFVPTAGADASVITDLERALSTETFHWRVCDTWLERDPANPTVLREGCSFAYNYGLYDVEWGWDNNPSTFPSSPRGSVICYGVNFGKEVHLGLIRTLPNLATWCTDGCIYRTQPPDVPWLDAPIIAGPISTGGRMDWINTAVVSPDPVTGCVVNNRLEGGFGRNGPYEIQFWGYTPDEAYHQVLLAPREPKLDLIDGKTVLSWMAVTNSESYRIEWKQSPESAWEVLKSGETALVYTNEQNAASAAYPFGYLYRISSQRGEKLAYTENLTFWPTDAPQALSADLDETRDGRAILTWQVPQFYPYTRCRVYRSTAPGGTATGDAEPQWELLTPDGLDTQSFVDTNAEKYVEYFYRVVYVNQKDGQTFEGPSSTTVSWTWCDWLEREPGNPKKVADSVTAFYDPKRDSRDNVLGAFDDNLKTHAYIYKDTGCRIGIDFGKPHRLNYLRAITKEQNKSSMTGRLVFGSNSEGNHFEARTQIADPIPYPGNGWAFIPVTDPTPYRYAYIEGIYRNEVAEIQFWGYDPANEPTILRAPENPSCVMSDTGMAITWESARSATAYRVEKLGSDGQWVDLTAGNPLTGEVLAFTDTTVETGTRCNYRIASINGDQRAYTETLTAVPYTKGTGVGLHAEYTNPYAIWNKNPNERLYAVTTNSINFDAGSGNIISNINDYLLTTWTGKLAVPEDGIYTFSVKSDDGFSLWLDDAPVLFVRMNSHTTFKEQASLYLTRGEHPITIYHNDDRGLAYCELTWSSPFFYEEPIPATQLIPVPPQALPAPWLGTRTLSQTLKGHTVVREDSAGAQTISLSAGGGGMDVERDRYHWLWRAVTNDFDAIVRYDVKTSVPDVTEVMLMAKNRVNEGNREPMAAAVAYMNSGKFNLQQKIRINNNSSARFMDMDETDGFTLASRQGWLRLMRIGKTFHFFAKEDHPNAKWIKLWNPVDTTEGDLNDELLLGPALGSSNEQVYFQVDFTDFSVSDQPDETLANSFPQEPQLTLVGDELTLSWKSSETDFEIERKGDDGNWTVVKTEVQGTNIVIDPNYDGTPRTYRMVAIRGGERFHSENTRLIAYEYLPGPGCGLHAVFRAPYLQDGYDPNEKVVAVQTNAVITGNPLPGDIPQDKVYVCWTGKLVVPRDGTYTFTVSSDDGNAFWIDQKPVLNGLWNRSTTEKKSVYLTQGEHDIKLDYQDLGGNQFCELKWSSPFIAEQVIPSPQLIPVPPQELPRPWAGERSFAASRKGASFCDPDKGTITLYSGSPNFPGYDGRHQLWCIREGDFDLIAHYRLVDRGDEKWNKFLLLARKELGLKGGSFAWTLVKSGGENGRSWVERTYRDSGTNSSYKYQAGPNYPTEGDLRLSRRGNRFYCYYKDLETGEWIQVFEPYTDTAGDFSGPLYVGPGMSAQENLQSYEVSELVLKSTQATILLLK